MPYPSLGSTPLPLAGGVVVLPWNSPFPPLGAEGKLPSEGAALTFSRGQSPFPPLSPCSPSAFPEFGDSLSTVHGDFFLLWLSIPTSWGGAALGFCQVMRKRRKSRFLALHHPSPPFLVQGEWIIWIIPGIPPLRSAFLASWQVAACSGVFPPPSLRKEEAPCAGGRKCWAEILSTLKVSH